MGQINRFWTRLTGPPNLWVCVTFLDAASVHNISDRGLRWYTVQVPTQLTTTMSYYIVIADQPQSCRLSHIPKSFNGQCFQGYGKYGGIFPCPFSMSDETSALAGPYSTRLPPGGRAAVTPPLCHPIHWKVPWHQKLADNLVELVVPPNRGTLVIVKPPAEGCAPQVEPTASLFADIQP